MSQHELPHTSCVLKFLCCLLTINGARAEISTVSIQLKSPLATITRTSKTQTWLGGDVVSIYRQPIRLVLLWLKDNVVHRMKCKNIFASSLIANLIKWNMMFAPSILAHKCCGNVWMFYAAVVGKCNFCHNWTIYAEY